jgi:hypothetical protein
MSSEPPASAELVKLAEATNAELEEAVNQATHQAFNLGCLLGLLPAVIFAVVIFLVSGFSLIGSLMAIVLGLTGAIAFANLAAMITRRNTANRKYQNEVAPSLARRLAEAGFTRAEFDLAARQTLSPTAPLSAFIQPPPFAGGDRVEPAEEETHT